MIRKTKDGLVEEFQIQGNRLIDGDGGLLSNPNELRLYWYR